MKPPIASVWSTIIILATLVLTCTVGTALEQIFYSVNTHACGAFALMQTAIIIRRCAILVKPGFALSSAILYAVLAMKCQIGETRQSCSVGNEDRETQQSCCVKNEIQYSENGIEIATEDAVGNHVADGVAVTQRSNTPSELLGRRFFMLCEVMVPTSIMVVIVGLCLIPTIYYALPESTAVQVRTLMYL